MMVLLDSGATHALRPASCAGEWDNATPTDYEEEEHVPEIGENEDATIRKSSMVRILKWQGGAGQASTAPETLRRRSNQTWERQEEEPSSPGISAIQAVTEAAGEAEKAARNALRAAMQLIVLPKALK